MRQRRSVLDLRLSQAATGDPQHVFSLCRLLADRLVFVPTVAQETQKGTVAVNVATLTSGGSEVVPVFTSRPSYNEWCGKNNHSEDDHVSLLAADLAGVLPGHLSISVNPGAEQELTLTPEHVRRMATFTSDNGFIAGGSGEGDDG